MMWYHHSSCHICWFNKITIVLSWLAKIFTGKQYDVPPKKRIIFITKFMRLNEFPIRNVTMYCTFYKWSIYVNRNLFSLFIFYLFCVSFRISFVSSYFVCKFIICIQFCLCTDFMEILNTAEADHPFQVHLYYRLDVNERVCKITYVMRHKSTRLDMIKMISFLFRLNNRPIDIFPSITHMLLFLNKINV